MQSPFQNAISDAERIISDVCAGRSCLGPCIESLRRSGTPGPCGCGAPGRRGLLWLWVLAVLAVLTAVFTVRAEVECVWMGNGYSCSGSGDTIHVIGGLPGGEGGGGSIVTNMIGTCTNCVAMSPQYVRDLKDSAISDLDECDSLNYVIGYEGANIIDRASFYTNECVVSHWRGNFVSGSTAVNNQITNFLHTVGANPGETPLNKAAQIVQSIDFTSGTSNQGNQIKSRLISYDSAAMAYNDAAHMASDVIHNASEITNASAVLSARLTSLLVTVGSLSDEQCVAQWDGTVGGGDDSSGGSVVTNQSSGNWCTYDQGEAIKELLRDCIRWYEKQISYLASCSNYLQSIDVSIRDALYSRYSAIPNEEGLGSPWQTVYLSGQPTSWGYEPTNILQRIELLLYGISGVGTNSVDITDTGEVEDDALESMEDAIDNIEADFSRQDDQLTSIRDHVRAFCEAFDVNAPATRNVTWTPRFYVRFEHGTLSHEESFDSVVLSEQGIAVADQIIEVIRTACIVVYYLLCAYCVFAFWRYIIKYVVVCIKWAQEILTSLFAD